MAADTLPVAVSAVHSMVQPRDLLLIHRGVKIAKQLKDESGPKLKDFRAALEQGVPQSIQDLKADVRPFVSQNPIQGLWFKDSLLLVRRIPQGRARAALPTFPLTAGLLCYFPKTAHFVSRRYLPRLSSAESSQAGPGAGRPQVHSAPRGQPALSACFLCHMLVSAVDFGSGV